MKAMVFAAGIGSRLGEFTRHTPKCLMEVGGKTMLEHTVDRLKAAGVNEIIINVHHLPQMILDLVQQKNFFGITVHFSHEDVLLDTGGGLKKVRDLFNTSEPFFIHNSDIFTTYDLQELLHAHRQRNALATLLILDRPSKRGLYFDRNLQLVGWTAQKDLVIPEDAKHFGFSGIHVADSRIFNFMPDKPVFSIIEPYLQAMRQNQLVAGYVPKDTGYWIDIGSPDKLRELKIRLEE